MVNLSLLFCGLCLWGRIPEILAKCSIVKLLPYVLLQGLYRSRPYTEVSV